MLEITHLAHGGTTSNSHLEVPSVDRAAEQLPSGESGPHTARSPLPTLDTWLFPGSPSHHGHLTTAQANNPGIVLGRSISGTLGNPEGSACKACHSVPVPRHGFSHVVLRITSSSTGASPKGAGQARVSRGPLARTLGQPYSRRCDNTT